MDLDVYLALLFNNVIVLPSVFYVITQQQNHALVLRPM